MGKLLARLRNGGIQCGGPAIKCRLHNIRMPCSGQTFRHAADMMRSSSSRKAAPKSDAIQPSPMGGAVMSVSSSRQQEIRQSIREFFDAAAKEKSESKVCPECGDDMGQVGMTFSLCGTDLNWTIGLPTCGCRAQNDTRRAA